MTDTFPRIESALSDRYLIVRELGQGGMATVYAASEPDHECPLRREMTVVVARSVGR